MRRDYLKQIRHCAAIRCSAKIQIGHSQWYRGRYNRKHPTYEDSLYIQKALNAGWENGPTSCLGWHRGDRVARGPCFVGKQTRPYAYLDGKYWHLGPGAMARYRLDPYYEE